MDANLGLFLTPLLLLPGVGLMLMSTAVRSGQVHGELHHLASHPEACSALPALIRRAKLFRDALISLYSAAALFALASLFGGVMMMLGFDDQFLILVLTCLGIVGVVTAAIQLVREALLSFDVVETHTRVLREGSEP